MTFEGNMERWEKIINVCPWGRKRDVPWKTEKQTCFTLTVPRLGCRLSKTEKLTEVS